MFLHLWVAQCTYRRPWSIYWQFGACSCCFRSDLLSFCTVYLDSTRKECDYIVSDRGGRLCQRSLMPSTASRVSVYCRDYRSTDLTGWHWNSTCQSGGALALQYHRVARESSSRIPGDMERKREATQETKLTADRTALSYSRISSN